MSSAPAIFTGSHRFIINIWAEKVFDFTIDNYVHSMLQNNYHITDPIYSRIILHLFIWWQLHVTKRKKFYTFPVFVFINLVVTSVEPVKTKVLSGWQSMLVIESECPEWSKKKNTMSSEDCVETVPTNYTGSRLLK